MQDEEDEAPLELVGYARVSTREQNLDLQINALRKAGVKPDRIFVEKVSGAGKTRPALERAIKLLRPGWTLVFWKLDRIARSMVHLLRVSETVKAKGANLRSITEKIDTTSALGALYFHMLGAFAQFERDIGRDRTRAGMQALRDKGVKLGRKRAFETKEQLAAVERDLQDLSMTIAQVAKKHGVSQPTIHEYFPAYRTRKLGKGLQGKHWEKKRQAAARKRRAKGKE